MPRALNLRDTSWSAFNYYIDPLLIHASALDHDSAMVSEEAAEETGVMHFNFVCMHSHTLTGCPHEWTYKLYIQIFVTIHTVCTHMNCSLTVLLNVDTNYMTE